MNVVFLVNSLIIGKIHAVTVEYARNTLWIWYRLSLQSGVIKKYTHTSKYYRGWHYNTKNRGWE